MATITEALAIAVQHHQSGQIKAAGEVYRQILRLDPNQPDALHLLGVIAHDLGNDEIAVEFIRRAIQLQGNSAESHYNLGGVYSKLQRSSEAIACFRHAIKLRPNFAEAYFNLGNEIRKNGELSESADYYCQALKLRPDFVDACVNLGITLNGLGKPTEAVRCYHRALELRPGDASIHSSLLMNLHYCRGMTLSMLRDAHSDFDQLHAANLRPLPPQKRNRTDLSRRLRVGFVSADLIRHPVGFFLIRAFENLGQESIDTYWYFDRSSKDAMTQRFQSVATQWRDVINMNDNQLAEQIQADRIDILFDLAGHTAENRLLVFARKVAPIQVTWAGYVGTTGLKAMDYILSDRYQIPTGDERYYQEQVLRMPDGYVSYDPPDYAPPVSPLSALDQGHVTFGCFNNPNKITEQAIAVWARILNRVPESRLIFKYRGWNDSRLIQRTSEMFALNAIDANRLEFLGHSPHAELLAEYKRIDLALDTFPYSGGLTTCEALWMGIPVVTCPGETFASRHSLSHLSNVGLTETIAHDVEDYADRAVALANDLPRLKQLRASLRDQMANSPLCDGKRFADDFTAILLDVWQQSFGESHLAECPLHQTVM